MKYLYAFFPIKIKVVFIMFFCNVGLGRFLKLRMTHSRSLAEVIALFFSPLSFTKKTVVQATFFSEELLIKTQMLARLHECLCKQRAEVPGHMNNTWKEKTDPLAEDGCRNGSQISE